MSVKPIQINVNEKNYKQNLNAATYEQLTFTNLKHFVKEKDDSEKDPVSNTTNKSNSSKGRHIFQLLQALKSLIKLNPNEKQKEVFQSAMKLCLISGQCLGQFPIVKFTETDISKLRYNIFSWRYLVCNLLLLALITGFSLTFYRIVTTDMSLTSFVYCIFFLATCLTTILTMHFSTKWNHLAKLVATSNLNEYLDPYIKFKCDFATVTVLLLAFVEHALAVMAKLFHAYRCFIIDANTTVHEQLIIRMFSYMFELNVPYTFGFGLFLQIFAAISTLAWTYPNVLIICISLYLTSILEVLNKKIISCEGQHLPESYWRTLREDYNRATRLVRSFDDVINPILFVSIGTNLFCVCTQFFFFFRSGTMIGSIGTKCPKDPTGLLQGYENIFYILFSLIFLLLRSFVVLIVAARIHTASLLAAPSLYSIPSSSYCIEVQRFLEQIHGDTVALTGLNFFHVTKGLVLSVIGTLVTYELVLLQFNE